MCFCQAYYNTFNNYAGKVRTTIRLQKKQTLKFRNPCQMPLKGTLFFGGPSLFPEKRTALYE